MVAAIFTGEVEDEVGLISKCNGMIWTWWVGIILLWSAMVLTVVTGADYLRKAAPYLKED